MRHLTLILLLLCIASPAAAAPIGYTLAPGSTITLNGAGPQALTGSLDLDFRGPCLGSVTPANCLLRYDIAAMSLIGGGQVLEFSGPLPLLPGVIFVPTIPKLGTDFPGSANLTEFIFDRETEGGPIAGVTFIHDRALISSPGVVAADAVFGDDIFPEEFSLELDLIQIERRSVNPGQFPSTLSRTVVGTLSITARPTSAVPEPTGAVLYAAGLLIAGRFARTSRTRPLV